MIAVFNSSRKSEASRLAQYLAAYYELWAWVCTGLGLAMHNTFRYFQLEAFCLHLVFLPDQEAQHSFTLYFMDTCYSHLLPPGLSLQEFLPPDQQPTFPVSVPFRAAKDLPHPPKSLTVATEAVKISPNHRKKLTGVTNSCMKMRHFWCSILAYHKSRQQDLLGNGWILSN